MRVGDKVRVPRWVRDKWSLPHLTDEYLVKGVDKEGYVTFYTGEPVNAQVGKCPRWHIRWHKSNLVEARPCLENK